MNLMICKYLVSFLLYYIYHMIKKKTKKIFSPVRIYALLISASTMIAILISLSTAVYSSLQFYIITNEEYIISRNGYYNECDPLNTPKAVGEIQYVERSPEEIADCNVKRTDGIVAERSVNFKTTLLASGTWFFVALLLFLFHLPMLRREEKD